MHMADALISPAVGGALWAVSGGTLALCARKVKPSLRDNLIPMMGVLGAFIFAAQMINFSIPGTGSSGHLGGGLILAILLGPYAAFIVLASVLTVQALFFADGGLLALGCNLFNLGFLPAFVAYPLIYRPLAGGASATTRAWGAAIAAAVAGLQLGALGVVLETRASGISELPLGAFALMMLPIHLAIGLVEGLATAAVVSFVAQARPEALPASGMNAAPGGWRPVLAGLAVATLVLGGVASWFASSHPDGLEWSMFKVSGKEELDAPAGGLHRTLAGLQERTAFLPDYGFKTREAVNRPTEPAEPAPGSWPAVNAGTSLSGLVGGLITLALAGVAGWGIQGWAPRRANRHG
jgi:cobalt/nickel transport system permease protein